MKRCRLQPKDYTVGWVCALPIELAAAQVMLDEDHEDLPQDDPNDTNLYTLGRIGDHNVVIACLPAGQTGNNNATAVAVQMKSKFTSVQFSLMVGIGGGVPSDNADVRLGDVVISQPDKQHGGVVQYDMGKTTPNGFQRTGSLNTPPTVLLNALSKLRANHLRGRCNLAQHLSSFSALPSFARDNAGADVLFEPTYNHVGGEKCEMCSQRRRIKRNPRGSQEIAVHCGTIASGNQVMRDGATRDRVSSELGGVLCFEMEAAGLMNNFPCLVIRGICDYADSHKNKIWQPYAATTAVACAKEVLSVIPAKEAINSLTEEMLQSVIDTVDLDLILKTLSVIDQKHISAIPPLEGDPPMFSWVFRNVDFKQWSSASCSQVLWLSAPPERSIQRVSSHIVSQEKTKALKTQHFVLHFFCSTAVGGKPIVPVLVHTFLDQIIRSSSPTDGISIARRFLYSLTAGIFKEEAAPRREEWDLRGEDSLHATIRKILEAQNDDLWGALRAALVSEQNREFLVVVDGLEHVQDQRSEFIPALRSFVEHLQQRFSKVKILLTSRPQADVKEIFEGLPCIEYDKERKECLSYLRFDNTRFGKISKEHEGSCEWLWSHEEYEKWSISNLSRLLLIQGKPGSGKSTLTKYFHDNLLERDPAARSAIVASFFYSYREGELQRNHSNMLRSILYDILHQDETFFYHRFQAEYRSRSRHGLRVDWDYESLKTVLKSLRDHSLARRLYLIIDAVDESEKNDRRDILELLLELCSETKFCVAKIFVASRPLGLLGDRNQFHNITMQDHTKMDISCFAASFLNRLHRKRFLDQARTYIVENAQGVFLWVELVGKELLTWDEEGYPESDIIEFLRCLPKDLEDFYTLMFKRINTSKENAQGPQSLQDRRNFRDLQDGVKMFRFVFWTRRPLTVDELRHALGIPDDPDISISDESFQIRIPPEHRIISCGGNFLEIKRRHGNGTVQVMHQTVRDFFLNPDGVVSRSGFLHPDGLVTTSGLETCEKAAHICISIICIRYLMLCAAHTAPVGTLPCKFWASEDFERYARLLNERPLSNYALCHLKHHIDSSHRDAMLLRIVSQFLDELADGPALYLLESWVRSHLNKTLISNEQGDAAADFRNKALFATVRKGFVTATEVLLAAGTYVDVKDQKGRTPLSWAAEQGNEVIARLLVEAGADKEVKDNNGRRSLHYAAEQGNEAIARLLVETGADKEVEAGHGRRRPLHYAAEHGHLDITRLLVKAGADKEARDGRGGRRPLHYAARNGHLDVARLLVEADADKEARDEHIGRQPLHYAAQNGHLDVARLLIMAGAYKDPENKYGRRPLHYAAGHGHLDVARLLVEAGANKEAKDGHGGRWPLHDAAEHGHPNIARLLIEAGAYKDPKDIYRRRPLHYAVEHGHLDFTRLLVEAGADKEAEDNDSRRPLHYAAEHGHLDITRLLVKAGADKEARGGHSGLWPLHIAAEHGHLDIARLLIEAGAYKDPEDNDRRQPLHFAAQNGHLDIAKLLIEAGADKEAEENAGRRPLHYAAEYGRLDVAGLLVEAGADKEAEDNYKQRPLYYATRNGHLEVARLLD